MNKRLRTVIFTTSLLMPTLGVIWAEMGGAPAARTGGFGEPTCHLSGCHIDKPMNAPGGMITITGLPANYSPSVVYPITVKVSHNTARRWGFELSSRFESTGQQAGEIRITNSFTQIKLSSSSPIRYITHNLLGTRPGTSGSAEFKFNWVAPTSPNGERVVFHAAGNAANNNSQPTGDFIYTTAARRAPAATTTTSTTTTSTTITTTSTTTTTATTSSTSSSTTTSTTTTLPTAGATLYFPRLVSNGTQFTGLAVANAGQLTAQVTFTAFENSGSKSGSPGSALEVLTNPSTRQMAPGRQIAEVAFQLFGDSFNTDGSWAEVTSDQPGVTGFYLTFDGALNTMDGTDVSDQLFSEFLLPELNMAEISMVNPSLTRQAAAVVSFVNNLGQVADSQTLQIPPKGRVSDLVSNLFDSSLLATGGYLSVSSDLGLAATEVFGEPGVFTAALNAIDEGGGGKELFSPQYVVGGGVWKTILTLINLEDVSTSVSLQLFGNSGSPLGNETVVDLPGRGRTVISDPSRFGISDAGDIVEGYVRVVSDSSRVAGYVRFGDPSDSQFQTALPFVIQGQNEVIYSQVAQDATFFTGVAIINPDKFQKADITVSVFDTDGNLVGRGTETIDPGARISKILTQIIPGLPPMSQGYFRVRSTRPVLSFGVFGTNTLSVLSAVPPQPLN